MSDHEAPSLVGPYRATARRSRARVHYHAIRFTHGQSGDGRKNSADCRSRKTTYTENKNGSYMCVTWASPLAPDTVIERKKESIRSVGALGALLVFFLVEVGRVAPASLRGVRIA